MLTYTAKFSGSAYDPNAYPAPATYATDGIVSFVLTPYASAPGVIDVQETVAFSFTDSNGPSEIGNDTVACGVIDPSAGYSQVFGSVLDANGTLISFTGTLNSTATAISGDLQVSGPTISDPVKDIITIPITLTLPPPPPPPPQPGDPNYTPDGVLQWAYVQAAQSYDPASQPGLFLNLAEGLIVNYRQTVDSTDVVYRDAEYYTEGVIASSGYGNYSDVGVVVDDAGNIVAKDLLGNTWHTLLAKIFPNDLGPPASPAGGADPLIAGLIDGYRGLWQQEAIQIWQQEQILSATEGVAASVGSSVVDVYQRSDSVGSDDYAVGGVDFHIVIGPTLPQTGDLAIYDDLSGTPLYLNSGNNLVFEAVASQSIYTGNGNNQIWLAGGNNFVSVGSGSNTIVGGGGTDTVIFNGNLSSYIVTTNSDSSISVVQGAVTDQLVHINQLQFADLTVTTVGAPASVAQEINGLYLTLYGIAATQSGITYWENVLHNFDPSVTTANAASTDISAGDQTYLGQQMTAGSPIVNGTTYFATLYPATMSDMAFVQALYQNMSNFIGTVAGDNYWFSLLQTAEANNGDNVIAAREAIAGQFVHDFLSNDLTAGAAALNVSQSDYTLLVAGQQALLNRAEVSQYYANETSTSGGSIINYTSVTEPAFTAAHDVVAAVTSDFATLTVAIAGINNAIAHQDLSLI